MEKFNTDNILISIIIPVKNGIHTIIDCLDGIRKQSLYPQCEIIAIDSGSVDGTIQYLQSQDDVQLKQIPPESFNHGLTRNLGVELSKGTFVVMTVQDASAADQQWLEKMIRHFDDPDVAGVCGQQVVPHHKDKNPHQWFRPVNKPGFRKVKIESKEAFDALSPEEKKKACSWDDVNAMYRRKVLEKIPFQGAFFAEDALWAKDALRAGYIIVYDTSAQVYHYHFQTYDYTYKRTLTQLYYSYKIFNLIKKNPTKYIDYLKIIYRNTKYKTHIGWIMHNFNIINARSKAFKDFESWLEEGNEYLENQYRLTCTTPPQGKVKKIKV